MGGSGEELDRLVRSAAEFTGIEPAMLDKSPFELSGGQKRRGAIAGVLAMDPEVIVLDEPAAGELKVNSYRYFKAVEAAENK